MKTILLFLPDTEVAVRYSISRSTVWRWLKEGKFPKPVKLGAASTRWHLADLEAPGSKPKRKKTVFNEKSTYFRGCEVP